ncbi:MAG: hypothetical protein KAR21_11900, partial [Spirochaetales bacterium]|nr:hypothetical protein [Spirochaetales bacterium]
MVITLNSEPFDVTIENEKTLDELLTGLSNWLSQSGYIITNVVQNDNELTLNEGGEWGNTPLATIEKLDIKAISESDKYISDLQTLYQYITLLNNSVSTSNNALTEDLLSELPFIKNSIDLFFGKKNKTAYETRQLENLTSNFNVENDNRELI